MTARTPAQPGTPNIIGDAMQQEEKGYLPFESSEETRKAVMEWWTTPEAEPARKWMRDQCQIMALEANARADRPTSEK